MEKEISLKKSFCVPYNGDLEYVKTLVDKYGDYIYEFYGTDNKFGSGRFGLFDESFRAAAEYATQNGIKFNYLLNSFVVEQYVLEYDEIMKHLLELKTYGVDTVTVSSPYFVKDIKELGFHVSTSLMQFINTEDHIEYCEMLGYDRIILDEDILKQVSLIEHLSQFSNLPTEIIINNTCLLHCGNRMTHCNAQGVSNPAFTEQMRADVIEFCHTCKDFWKRDFVHFLKSSWVRPEELIEYKKRGVELFKLTGRTRPSFANIKILDIYISQSYDGNMWDYLMPHRENFMDNYGFREINNKEMDGFFKFFFNGKSTCSGGQCSKCRHCESWARKLSPNLTK